MESPLQPPDWYRLNRFLRTLETRPPVVSVHVPAGQEAKFAKVLEHPPREAPPEPPLDGVAAALRRALAGHGPAQGTLCLFGWSPERPEVRFFEIPRRLKRFYGAGDAPHVAPLRELLEPLHSFLLVQTDHQDATVRRYSGFDIVVQKRVHSYVERHHRKGGASAARYQREQREQIHQHLVKVRKTLEKFAAGADPILVGGPGTAKAQLMEVLGAALAPRARLVEGLGPATSGEGFFHLLRDALGRFREEWEAELVERAAGGVGAGLLLSDPAAIGRALEAGAVETLLVASDHLPEGPEEASLLRMLEAAGRTGAEVAFITRPAPGARLRDHGPVAARLRYALKSS